MPGDSLMMPNIGILCTCHLKCSLSIWLSVFSISGKDMWALGQHNKLEQSQP